MRRINTHTSSRSLSLFIAAVAAASFHSSHLVEWVTDGSVARETNRSIDKFFFRRSSSLRFRTRSCLRYLVVGKWRRKNPMSKQRDDETTMIVYDYQSLSERSQTNVMSNCHRQGRKVFERYEKPNLSAGRWIIFLMNLLFLHLPFCSNRREDLHAFTY